MEFIHTLWDDVAGKIFLITFVSYLTGYLIYGGYLFSFFGKKASFPFGLFDFSITDLISIFPAGILTLVDLIIKLFPKLLKVLIFQLLIPFAVALTFSAISGLKFNRFGIDDVWIGFLASAGLAIWLGGLLFFFYRFSDTFLIVSFFLETIGLIMFFLALPNPGEPTSILLAQKFELPALFNSLLRIILLFEIAALVYIFGNSIAKTAIKLNLLVKIDRFVLNQPVLQAAMLSRAPIPSGVKVKSPINEWWLMQKQLPVNLEPELYEWRPSHNEAMYLIAAFEKFIILYSVNQEENDHRTFVINRDVLLSLEIAHQTDVKNH